jgi:hypothetical protein
LIRVDTCTVVGYRLMARRNGDRRLFTRRGFDLSDRCPSIVVGPPHQLK